MADALFSEDDYIAAQLALLPRGRVWPKDADSIQHAVAAGLAPSWRALDARAQTLLVDAFPATTLELLPEWEASLGLPDPCEGDGQGLEQRRTQVVSRLTSAGGQSVGYFLGVVAQLGYTGASIRQYAPFRVDRDGADQTLYGEDWAFAWTLNLPDLRVFYFQPDISAAGEALMIVANDVAACVVNALKPAHTTVIYTNDLLGLDFSDPDNSQYLPAL
jgi:uncharacterized protein YmfQ (DUF2313 family)